MCLVNVLGERERTQPPPPHILWEALVDPLRDDSRPWLRLAEDEVMPEVLEAERPSWVVWSSLWPSRPRDRLCFSIARDGEGGSKLRWRLESPDDVPDAATVGHLRYRINYLINGEMRYSFGQ
jgi:hypothetical protein